MPPKFTEKQAHPLPEPVERVVTLLLRLKWRRVRSDLSIHGAPDKLGKGYDGIIGHWPVFEVGARRCVVGPTWTTFYSVNYRSIEEGTLRSVKTRDLEVVEAEAEGTRHQIDMGGEG